jgi:hypothetical protein
MSIRDFLLNFGLANLVIGLETRFQKVAYFTTSAIEELPATNRPAARPRAAVHLLWLMQQGGDFSAALSPKDTASTTAKAPPAPGGKKRPAPAAA